MWRNVIKGGAAIALLNPKLGAGAAAVGFKAGRPIQYLVSDGVCGDRLIVNQFLRGNLVTAQLDSPLECISGFVSAPMYPLLSHGFSLDVNRVLTRIVTMKLRLNDKGFYAP